VALGLGGAMAAVIIDEQLPSIRERDSVGARVRVRQVDRGERAPGFAGVLRPRLRDHALLRAAQRLERTVLVSQNARLNRIERGAFADRSDLLPCFTRVAR